MSENYRPVNYKDHWDSIYIKTESSELGWYESDVTPTLKLIAKSNVKTKDCILCVGAGTTTLIDTLLGMDYNNLVATDISEQALNKLKVRLGRSSLKVNWIVGDLTSPEFLNSLETVDLWIDRAVLHFFTQKKDRDAYFETLRRIVRGSGFVILAQFDKRSADKCSGLPVHRYTLDELKEQLGPGFNLVDSFNYDYTMPTGDTRSYIYTLFQRVN